ncbi:ATP-binding cassette, subfamily C, CydC [Formivibrio citricus]|uniref:ATP-binding cassette, subfamily C, CydC n=2 Tax=Formivibrio citricus TaxID=83765 RepID=A0A1I4VTJ2_9NEIS|nr:ATP-binding cassette, subfamily C, CydC [Formivibrio citricus]
MRDLLPFLRLMLQQRKWLILGMALTLACLISGLGLLGTSGAFLTGTAIAGLSVASTQAFNFLLPSAGVRFFAIARTATRWLERVVTHDATFRLIGGLRVWLYRRLVRLSPRQLGGYHGADVLNRLTRDIDALDNLYLRLFLPMLAAAICLALLGAVLVSQAPVLLWPWLGLTLLSLLVLPWLAYRIGRPLAPRLVQAQSDLRRDLLDAVDGLEDFSLHAPAWAAQRQKVLAGDSQRIADQLRLQRMGSLLRALQLFGVGLTVWLVITLAASQSQAMSGPWLAALVLLVLGSLEIVQGLPLAWLELPGTLASAARLQQLAEQTPDPAYVEQGPQPAGFDLALHEVGFAYDPLAPVLERVSLTVAAGEHVALLGPSGGGKTTLIQLLSRLLDPQQGEIRLGGQPLTALDEDTLRAHVACAAQEPWLFTAPLADNLRLAQPDASDAELWAMLDLVGLKDTVAAWPDGLQTWIEERGASLSGGERRRLGLARALLRNAPVTLLDEPTEGLDPASEQEIIRRIRRHQAGRTLVWVTHRSAGLADFDRVFRLENGCCPEQ